MAATRFISILTIGADSLVGTSGVDTFGGAVSTTAALNTFTAIDKVDGGAGVDRLVLALDGTDYNGGATVTNVEEIVVTTSGVGAKLFNASGISGLTLVGSNASQNTTTFNNVASKADVLVANQGGIVTVNYTDAAVAGTSDSVKVNLSNITANSTINLNATSATTGASGFETINVVAAGAVADTATVTLNTNTTQATTLINFSGANSASYALGVNLANVATLDATASTGGVTVSGVGAVTTTFKGGSGNDQIQFGANFNTSDVVDGGAGTDTLGANAAQLAAIVAKATNVSNIETIRVQDDAAAAASIDLSFFGATNARIAGQSGGGEIVTINNLVSTSTVRFDGGQNGTVLNVKDATLPGTADVLNIDLRGGAVTYTTSIAGVETLNVTASKATGASTLAITDSALTTLNLINTGGNAIDTGTLGAAVSKVDASGVTGAAGVTITLNGAATTGANVTGSASGDGINGSNLIDVINGGAGNDIINGGSGADLLTGGSGADTFSFTATVGANASGITFGQADVITDFVTGTDKIQFAGVADVASGQQVAVQAAVTALAAGATDAQIATAMATANTTNLGVSFAVYNGNTYVLYETAGASTGVAADDVFIKLAGITTLPTFAADVIA